MIYATFLKLSFLCSANFYFFYKLEIMTTNPVFFMQLRFFVAAVAICFFCKSIVFILFNTLTSHPSIGPEGKDYVTW